MRRFTPGLLFLVAVTVAACKTNFDTGSGTDQTGIALDKTVIVYQANDAGSRASRLYAAATDASATHVLTRDPAASVAEYAVSPAGVDVAYRLTGDSATPDGLYIANVYTGTVAEITGRPGAPVRARSFAWSPSGTHIAYTGADDISSPGRLYIYGLATGRSVLVSPGGNAAHTLSALQATPDQLLWSPDGAALAYRSDYGSSELNAVAPDGTAYRKLSGTLVADGAVHDVISWSPDSSRIAYVAAQSALDTLELFATNFDGSGNTRLSPALDSGEEVLAAYWSPDSRNIALAVTRLSPAAATVLSGSSADGSHNWTIATNLLSSGAVDPAMVEWSPDSAYIAYLADHDGDGRSEYYSADVAGAAVFALSPAGSGRPPQSLAWAPTGNLVAYTLDAETAEKPELYTSSQTGGVTRVKISGTLPANASVRDFSWDPLGTALVYRVVDPDRIAVRIFDRSSNATVAIATASLAPLLIAPEWLSTTGQIAFVADLDTPDVGELYVADDSGNVTKISHPIDRSSPLTGEDIVSFALVP